MIVVDMSRRFEHIDKFFNKIVLLISINYSTINFFSFSMIEFIMQMLNNLKFVSFKIDDFSHEYIFIIFSKRMMILHFVSQIFVFEKVEFFNHHNK